MWVSWQLQVFHVLFLSKLCSVELKTLLKIWFGVANKPTNLVLCVQPICYKSQTVKKEHCRGWWITLGTTCLKTKRMLQLAWFRMQQVRKSNKPLLACIQQASHCHRTRGWVRDLRCIDHSNMASLCNTCVLWAGFIWGWTHRWGQALGTSSEAHSEPLQPTMQHMCQCCGVTSEHGVVSLL